MAVFWWDVNPLSATSDYLRQHREELRLEQGVEELVYALTDSGVVATTYSCEGHFRVDHSSAFCHHNQKAQIHLYVKNLPLAAALCNAILRWVEVDGIAVSVTQTADREPEYGEISVTWSLEFRPVGYWDIRPQDSGVFIAVADGWSESIARARLEQAIAQAINVCRQGQWRASGGVRDAEPGAGADGAL